MKIGDKLKGLVTGLQPYGAFVELENKAVGLIHISEIKAGYIENIRDYLKTGDHVVVQVVDVDEATGKASLSLRTLSDEKPPMPKRHRFTSPRHQIGFASLEKQMPIWIKESKQFLEEKKTQET